MLLRAETNGSEGHGPTLKEHERRGRSTRERGGAGRRSRERRQAWPEAKTPRPDRQSGTKVARCARLRPPAAIWPRPSSLQTRLGNGRDRAETAPKEPTPNGRLRPLRKMFVARKPDRPPTSAAGFGRLRQPPRTSQDLRTSGPQPETGLRTPEAGARPTQTGTSRGRSANSSTADRPPPHTWRSRTTRRYANHVERAWPGQTHALEPAPGYALAEGAGRLAEALQAAAQELTPGSFPG